MVFPFELYCKVCGGMILSSKGDGSPTDMLRMFEEEESVDSWITNKLLGHGFRCPHCKRMIAADPLIRAEVLFGEWGDTSGAGTSQIIFYV
jgi:hypothetical protein